MGNVGTKLVKSSANEHAITEYYRDTWRWPQRSAGRPWQWSAGSFLGMLPADSTVAFLGAPNGMANAEAFQAGDEAMISTDPTTCNSYLLLEVGSIQILVTT